MFGIEIVDHDQIEIGGRRHLAAAELAERQNRGFLAFDAAVQLDELLFDRAMQRANQHVGEPRKGLAGLLRRHGARQNPRADQEHLLLREDADAVEEVLIAPGLRKRAVEHGLQLVLFRQRAEEARIDHCVHDVGELREAVGEPRRGAEHHGDQRDQVGILPQQREQPAGAMQPGCEAVEGEQRRVGTGGAGEVGQQQRHELSELIAGMLTAQRPVAAREPLPHPPRGFERLLESHGGKLVERFAVVGIERKRQRTRARFGSRGGLEESGIVPLHIAQMAEQRLGKTVAVGKAEETGEALQSFAVTRQRMGLLVRNHLQAVLEHAQESIGGTELIARLSADPAAFG